MRITDELIGSIHTCAPLFWHFIHCSNFFHDCYDLIFSLYLLPRVPRKIPVHFTRALVVRLRLLNTTGVGPGTPRETVCDIFIPKPFRKLRGTLDTLTWVCVLYMEAILFCSYPTDKKDRAFPYPTQTVVLCGKCLRIYVRMCVFFKCMCVICACVLDIYAIMAV